MTEFGYALSSEEHSPSDLVLHAQMAEQAGFTFALISDHFHPWLGAQGQSPFVWSVLGGIAQVTKKLRLGTGVTCPIIRTHPAIIAQAAATIACMMPDRFFLGVGTGENLNEHILGDKWPRFEIRMEMLGEAIKVMRQLWRGGLQSFEGTYYTVDNAQLYTLPKTPVEIYVAASGEKAAKLAGREGDGFINTKPDKRAIMTFATAGGKNKPRIGKLTVCWAKDKAKALQTVMKYWRQTGLQGPLSQELALPEYFEQASTGVRVEDVEKEITCGPDVNDHVAAVKQFVDAGYKHVYFHQIGPDQEGFIKFFESELGPRLRRKLA